VARGAPGGLRRVARRAAALTGTGTDAAGLWLRVVAGACFLTVATTVFWRIAPRFSEVSR
jgi:hypothetical protein